MRYILLGICVIAFFKEIVILGAVAVAAGVIFAT